MIIRRTGTAVAGLAFVAALAACAPTTSDSGAGSTSSTTVAAKPCLVTSPTSHTAPAAGATQANTLGVSVIGPVGGACTQLAGHKATLHITVSRGATQLASVTGSSLTDTYAFTVPYELTVDGVDAVDISARLVIDGTMVFSREWRHACTIASGAAHADCYRPGVTDTLTIPA